MIIIAVSRWASAFFLLFTNAVVPKVRAMEIVVPSILVRNPFHQGLNTFLFLSLVLFILVASRVHDRN